jgi:hypothetical protein
MYVSDWQGSNPNPNRTLTLALTLTLTLTHMFNYYRMFYLYVY